MIVGYNHNVSYRGKTFHVQTEDSGPLRPQLVTLLYLGGTIISSKKTVYADIIKVDHLDKVVEELAKEQHKGMLRGLTRGEFDQRIAELGIALEPAPVKAEEAVRPVAQTLDDPGERVTEETAAGSADHSSAAIVAEPGIDKFKKSKPTEPSLEQLIYAYLTAGQKGS
ncbi:hypothetical protein [Pelovirga terrestris]|uniref:Uncharacterized protein n=1 Tax=Pelovirga terrestris TaxID=2771352 RepID=A0A8J6QM96_9BACT|nr:hypothetical protein [Pelovirga terrestris]MBD1401194.1 hypothetical protein [Pelovirga terrestris]